MDRKVPFYAGEIYHIYNRGVNKGSIFFTKNDWKHFHKLLYTRNSEKRIDSTLVKNVPFHKIDRGKTIVDILAYTLMYNHFHILLKEKQEGGISKFMSKLSTAHSMYMNKKYERSGPLMCRPFRSQHIDSDEYLRWIISYIHMNPIEHNETLNYKYSSYTDYFNKKRMESLIIEHASLPIDIENLREESAMEKVLLTF